MANFGPPQPISPDSPLYPGPEPPRIGLVRNASTPTVPANHRYSDPIAFAPAICDLDGGIFDPCSVNTSVIGDNPDIVTINPFGVWTGYKCFSTQWLNNPESYRAKAEQKLLATESAYMAREFWRGDLSRAAGWDNQFLADNSAEEVTGGPSSVTQALSCLEARLASCANGSRGMIHVPRHVLIAMSNANLLRYESGQILTYADSIVISDAGYDGSGPATTPGGAPTPQTTGSVWMYATTRVFVLREPTISIIPPDGDKSYINRDTNLVELRASRAASVYYSGCCLLAAEVELALCQLGS